VNRDEIELGAGSWEFSEDHVAFVLSALQAEAKSWD